MAVTLAQIGNNYTANLYSALMAEPDSDSAVLDISNGRNTVEDLINMNNSVRRVDGEDGHFRFPVMGVIAIVANIASTAQSGLNLIVTLADNTYDGFRLSEVVSDGGASGSAMGKVIAHSPGSITIEPYISTMTLTAGTNFLAGGFVTMVWDSQYNTGSGAMENRDVMPQWVYANTVIDRDNFTMKRNEWQKTYPKTTSGGYWYLEQQGLMYNNIRFAKQNRIIWDVRGTSGSGATASQSMSGLFEILKDPVIGGYYQPMSTVMGQADFETWCDKVALQQNSSSGAPVQVIMGTGQFSLIRSFMTPIITQTGTLNTFGVKSGQGFDTYQYTINGHKFEFIVNSTFDDIARYPTLSTIASLQTFPRRSYTMLVIDKGNTPTVTGGSEPAMQMCVNAIEGTGVYNYFMPGVGMNGLMKDAQPLMNAAGFAMAVTHADVSSIGQICYWGLKATASRCAGMELVV